MAFVVSAPPVPSVAVKGGPPEDRFPVRRIYCVGRNYVDHAIEMGHSGREAPFFFMKPADAVIPIAEGTTGEMHYPSLTTNLHHEIELVVAIGKGGKQIPADRALDHVWGYAVGLDMTRRDRQDEAKKLGRPWSVSKGFDESAPIGPLVSATNCRLTPESAVVLEVNGAARQSSTIGHLIWSVAEIVENISNAWTLAPGDLIFTGTPAGVAAVVPGDLLHARIDGVGTLDVRIVP